MTRLAGALLASLVGLAHGAGLLVLGDSTHKGVAGGICYTCYSTGTWTLQPAGYLPMVARAPSSYLADIFGTIDNQAVGGQSSSRCITGQASGGLTTDGYFLPAVSTPAVPSFATILAGTSATTVLLGHGVLDAREVSTSTYKTNLRTMADAVLKAGKALIFDTPQFITEGGSLGYTSNYAQAMREVHAEYAGSILIDSWKATRWIDLPTYGPTEGVHYTQAGQTIRGTYAARYLMGRTATPNLPAAKIVAIVH